MKRTLFFCGVTLCSGLLLAQTDQQNMPAQTNATTSSTSGSSWTGLLVAMGCDNNVGSGTAMSGMNRTSNDMTGSAQTGVTQTPTATNGQASSPDMARATTPVPGDTSASNSTPDRNNATNTGASDRNSDINAGRGTSDRVTGDASASASADQNLPRSTASAAAGSNMNSSDISSNSGSNDRSSWEHARMVAGQLGASCRINASTSSFALRTPDGQLIPFDSASNAKIADQVRSRVSANSSKIFRVVVQGTMNGGTISVNSIRL